MAECSPHLTSRPRHVCESRHLELSDLLNRKELRSSGCHTEPYWSSPSPSSWVFHLFFSRVRLVRPRHRRLRVQTKLVIFREYGSLKGRCGPISRSKEVLRSSLGAKNGLKPVRKKRRSLCSAFHRECREYGPSRIHSKLFRCQGAC